MSAILALLGAKGMAVLSGIIAALAGLAGIFLAGKRSQKAAARADRAEASLATRTRIDEATDHAPTDADAARDALARRVPRKP